MAFRVERLVPDGVEWFHRLVVVKIGMAAKNAKSSKLEKTCSCIKFSEFSVFAAI